MYQNDLRGPGGVFTHYDPIRGQPIESYSQAGQDLFVLAMLQEKSHGSFLEIGAGHASWGNNTYLLERKYNFSGLSLDLGDSLLTPQEIDNDFESFYHIIKGDNWPSTAANFDDLPAWVQQECSERGCLIHCEKIWSIMRPDSNYIQTNAFDFDYSNISNYYDYLQIDLDSPNDSLALLEKILPNINFAVITYEHDIWTGSPVAKLSQSESRRIFADYGYEMIVNDVTIKPGMPGGNAINPTYFEDWYVNPNIIPGNIIEKYKWIDFSNYPKYFDDILFHRFLG
jgi:hypothetical protein